MRSRPSVACVLNALEQRLLNCVEGYDALGLEYAAYPVIQAAAAVPATSKAALAKSALSALPVLHTNSSATAKLFIDFDGAPATSWGGMSVPATPAFDQDGDATTFSDTEVAAIREIVARVGEKYSPFKLDVTTEDPGVYLDRKTQRLVVGGSGSWYGSAGGVSYVGAFYNSSSNTSWVFSRNTGNGNAKYTAEAVAHEAGHAFGLDHQSTYDAGGRKTDEYNSGDARRAPTMGNSYDAARGLWWKGTSSVSRNSIQDDMSILGGSGAGFGFRTDDYGNTLNAATALQLSGLSVSGAGIISNTSDADVFSFTTGAGSVTFTGAVVNAGPTLDLKLQLYNASGTLVATADTASLGESMAMNLAAGTYRLVVASHGGYGDVGQYTISGKIVAAGAVTVASPAGLSASAVGNSAALGWTDRAGNESAYVVERSANGGTSWSTIATLAANAAAYTDDTVVAGGSYQYRVFAKSGTIRSDNSNTASVTMPDRNAPVTAGPAAPSNLLVTRKSYSRLVLSWKDNSDNEDGFQIEYSSDGVRWRVLGFADADTTAVSLYGFLKGRTVSFRVLAYNADADSNYSNTATLGANAASSAKPKKTKLPVAKG